MPNLKYLLLFLLGVVATSYSETSVGSGRRIVNRVASPSQCLIDYETKTKLTCYVINGASELSACKIASNDPIYGQIYNCIGEVYLAQERMKGARSTAQQMKQTN
jgi:hypothetical protein